MKFVPDNEECLAYWLNGEVVLARYLDNYGIESKYDNLPCVDMSEEYSKLRYGIFRNKGCSWNELPYDQFPADFRMALMLLGIE